MKWTYLLINVLTIAGPLARSFESKVQFWRSGRALWPAILVTLLVFVAWDALFTHWGVWGFTDRYLIGWRLLGLPIEEILFFVTVPYACLFLYALEQRFVRRDWLGAAAPWIAMVLTAMAILVVALHWGQLYTCSAFGLMAALLVLHGLVLRTPWLGRFFIAYAVSLVPMLVVNGVLTGAITEAPIVWYDDTQNLGIRLGTIPLDDFAYGMDLLLLNVSLFEALRGRMR